MHKKLNLSSLQKSASLSVTDPVFSLHQNEPKPGMLLSSHAGGDGGLGGGGGADGGSPSHKSQVFLHRFFFSSVYLLHFFFLQVVQLSACQPQYRVCQCEPAAVWHGQSCRRRRRREQQTFVGAENDVAGCCLVAGCRGAGMAVGDNCESGRHAAFHILLFGK